MIDQLAKDLSQYRLKKANDLLAQAILLYDNQAVSIVLIMLF